MLNFVKEGKIGVVGSGLIGASWAGLISAFGYETILYDPKKEAVDQAINQIAEIWSSLETLHGQLQNKKEVKVVYNLEGLKECSFVQENCPEDLNLKRELISNLINIVPNETIIASSTSSFLPSELQYLALNPSRVIVGHPMNPPHLIPLVEIVMEKSKTKTFLRGLIIFILHSVERQFT